MLLIFLCQQEKLEARCAVTLNTHTHVCAHQDTHFEQIKCHKNAKHSTMSVSRLFTTGSLFTVTAFLSASFAILENGYCKNVTEGAKKGIAIRGWCPLEKLPPYHVITHMHKYWHKNWQENVDFNTNLSIFQSLTWQRYYSFTSPT